MTEGYNMLSEGGMRFSANDMSSFESDVLPSRGGSILSGGGFGSILSGGGLILYEVVSHINRRS